jgi:hypothetical protein
VSAQICWQVYSGAGTVIGEACQTINVQDLEPPVLTCPSNQIINLNPGLCCAIVSWAEPTITDNCPFIVPGPTLQFPISMAAHGGGTAYTLQGNTLPGGVFFNVQQRWWMIRDHHRTSVCASATRPSVWSTRRRPCRSIPKTGTFQGFENNQAAWTNLGPSVVTAIAPYFATGQGTLSQAPINQNVTIAPGATQGFMIYGQTACIVFNYFNTTQPVINGRRWKCVVVA